MTGSGNVDNDLELVRRGFDPSQVQQLVGQLSAELKTMAADNDRLRARVTELESSPAATTPSDIFGLWSKETNDLMDAARASIASVTDKATADAAAALAAGEIAATAIRQRAQIDAEGIVAGAKRQAEQTAADAAAEKARVEAEAQATVDQANAQVAALEAKLAELRGQRSTMSEQLSTAKSHLLQLMSLVDEPEDTLSGASPISTAGAADSVTNTSEETPTADEQH
jgi:cell division septum initiation protein DivIVA